MALSAHEASILVNVFTTHLFLQALGVATMDCIMS